MIDPGTAVGAESGLLEREAALAELEADVDAALNGEGRFVLVDGPAGIGKTAALDALRTRARGAGMAVAHARGAELEHGFAFGVVRQLYERRVCDCSSRERARLLRGQAGLARDVVGAAGGEPLADGDRLPAVIHGLYWLTLNIAEQSPLLVLIDDAHWADPPSMRFLSYLAGRLEGTAVLVVVAVTRPGGQAGHSVLASLARERAGREVELDPLSVEATAKLVQRGFGVPVEAEFALACHRSTGGIPFFVRELVRALRADRISPTAGQAGRVSRLGAAGIAEALITRIGPLSSPTGAVARTLAVLGGEASVRDLALVSAVEQDAVVTAVDELIAIGVTAGHDPVAFTHPIVQASIYADIPPGERTKAHQRAAHLLDEEGREAERSAAHLLAIAPSHDSREVGVLRRAAGEALSRGAPDAAAAYLRRALAEPLQPADRAEVAGELGRAEYLAHDRGATGHLLEAMEHTLSAERRAELALEAATALIMAEPDRSVAAVELLDQAITNLAQPGSELSMRLEAQLLGAAGLKLETRELHRARLDDVYPRRLDDGPAERALLANLAQATVIDGRVPGRFPDLARHAGAATAPADIAGRAAERALGGGRLLREQGSDSLPVYLAIGALFMTDFHERAARSLDDALDDARTRGSVIGYAQASAFHAEVALRRGDLDAAEAHARAAFAISRGDAMAALLHVLVEQGRLGEADAVLADYPLGADDDHLMIQPIRAAAARLRLAQGRATEAADLLASCRRWLEAWPVTNPGLVPWRSATALTLGPAEQHEALRLAQQEAEIARALGTPRALGIALRALGLLAGGSDGIDLLHQATVELERSDARLEHARALVDYGAALRRGGHRADARTPLREGSDLAHRCHATALADSAHHELLATGARPRRPALTGRDALTATEARVADMAASGLSTPEIAQALFVTPKTIETHLHHVYRKLGIHSRSELRDAQR